MYAANVIPAILLLLFAASPEPPVIQAVRSGNPAVRQQLIDKKDGIHALGTNGQTALHEAAARCNIYTAQVLVDAGLDRKVRDKQGNTAAMIAADCPPSPDREQLIRVLMAPVPADFANNESMRWSLQDAASRGDRNVLNMLLQMGADVNRVGNNGNRAVEIAARKGDYPTTKLLLERGADAKLKTSAGTTLLHEAALGGSAEVVALIIAYGVDLHTPDTETGATPLHMAASFNRADAVKALLKAGADRNRRDSKGRTALDLARSNEYKEIVDILR